MDWIVSFSFLVIGLGLIMLGLMYESRRGIKEVNTYLKEMGIIDEDGNLIDNNPMPEEENVNDDS